jgi:hypothetical protein
MATVPAGGAVAYIRPGRIEEIIGICQWVARAVHYDRGRGDRATKERQQRIKAARRVTCPAAFVPSPKPQVWKVTRSVAVRVKVVSKVSSGELSVPV